MRQFWICAVGALIGLGCPPPRSESPTKGQLQVLATESLASLIQREADEFHRLYPDASVTVYGTSTRDAIVQMLNDSVRFIVVDREFNAEEEEVAKKYEIKYVETRIAEDALAVLVHAKNPSEKISFASLENILRGKSTTWRKIPESKWRGDVELVLTPRNSGAFELLMNHFFRLQEPIAPNVIVQKQHDVLRHVAANERAMGFVSLTALHDTAGYPNFPQLRAATRVLAVEGTDSAVKGTFVQLHQANVHRLRYPLHYPVYLYTTAGYASLASGFSAFITSSPGQKIIQKAGLAPATVPVRLVQTTQGPVTE